MRRIIFLVILLLITVLGAYLFFFKIKITTIRCKSQFGPCSKSIEDLTQKSLHLTVLSARKSLENVLSGEDKINKFKLHYLFPNTYTIDVVENKGEVAVSGNTTGPFKLFSREGVYIDEVADTSLPKVLVKASRVNDKDIKSAIIITYNLSKIYSVSLAELTSEGLAANVSGLTITFPLDRDIDVILGSLQLILSRLNTLSENHKISSVDLRYENPVIK